MEVNQFYGASDDAKIALMAERAMALEGEMLPEVPIAPRRRRATTPSLFRVATSASLVERGVIHPLFQGMYDTQREYYGSAMLSESATGRKRRASFLIDVFFANYDVVKMGGERTYFYRRRGFYPAKYDPSKLLYPLYMERCSEEQFDNLIKQVALAVFPGALIADEIGKICKYARDFVTDSITEFDTSLVGFNDEVFFDTKKADFVRMDTWIKDHEGEEPPRVYIKLGKSTDDLSGDRVRMPELDDKAMELIMSRYYQKLNVLAGNELEPYDHKILMDWACGSKDIYRDILHMFSTVFMYRKPLGVYFLVGTGRNGKSSCLDLITSIVGTDNTTRLKLRQLGDPHYVESLPKSLLNAPDESSEITSKEDIEIFKIAAAHNSDASQRFFQQGGTKVTYHCALLFPVNEIPKWSGSHAEACLRRTLPISFLADFAISDLNAGKSWGELNYTDEFLLKLTGDILAYAHYYARHPWEETIAMQNARQSIEEIGSSSVTYIRQWETFFRGFHKFKLVKQDYENWCNLRELNRESFEPRGSVRWQRYTHSSYKPTSQSKQMNIYACGQATIKGVTQGSKMVMYENLKIEGLMDGKTLGEYLEAGGSVIYALEERRDNHRGYTEEDFRKYATQSQRLDRQRRGVKEWT